MPWTLIMPTGGVEKTTRESIEAWFKAGVACVGIGSNLIRKELVAAGDFDAISGNTAEVLQWIREARGRGGVEGQGTGKNLLRTIKRIDGVIRPLTLNPIFFL